MGLIGLIFPLVLALLFAGAAAADFDSGEWKRFREVRIPPHFPDGLAGISLDSELIEKSRRDMADLRLVSSNHAVVPFTIVEGTAGDDGEAFPAKVFRMARKQGKWTDIWIDKQAKILTQGVLIQTPSKDFVRKVEIRGSDNTKESYVVQMDGLVADLAGPVPVRSLNVFYHLNNFQYVHIRIIDDDKPPLKVDGILCYPPPADSNLSWPLDVRIRENRSDPATGSTTIVADLGEKRFPTALVRLSSPTNEFTKKVLVYGASSSSPESWKRIFEGTMFRLRREEAVKESLEARFSPQTYRYLKLELSGGTRGAVSVDKLRATAAVRMAVFKHQRGQDYRLFFDNPKAGAASGGLDAPSINVNEVAAASSEISLGQEQKNIVSPSPPQRPEMPRKADASSLQKILGVTMLLAGLLLLFIIMLKVRWSKRSRGRRGAGAANTGF
ncbi:MAG: DUF3999 family protein [Desulfomonile tiedjei]|nr:DUF3999 family protein [Desulfomonile tiedjei]